ncbi:MAG: HEAT repeat domain-containing protein [Gammaproteobacteria bacterium]|nr:HEAT repeat domain-containing protein [Gammaproteobacteria bacterium]
MSLLDGLKASKAISTLLESSDPKDVDVLTAISRIKEIGRPAVSRLIDALLDSPNNPLIENVLLGLLDNKSLSDYVDALTDPDKNLVSSIARILVRGTNYDPNSLLRAIDDPDIPKKVLLQILITKKERLNPRKIIGLLGELDPNKRGFAFSLIGLVVTEEYVPSLIAYAASDDFSMRLNVIRVLSRFNIEPVRGVLLHALTDSNKHIRLAALEGMSSTKFDISAQHICPLLKDPDLNVQAKAIEALIRINDPNTVGYLIEILNDNSEYIRRAAVEVLNEIADHRAIKNLLNAMRDTDWWVRVRAADALGSIGGPRVVEAIMGLLRDEDEFLRRTAVEILNSVKDERAYFYLVQALNDSDWWVRERAIDALGQFGDKRAIPELFSTLEKFPESATVLVQTLIKLGGDEIIGELMERANATSGDVRKELLFAISEFAKKQKLDVNSSVENSQTHILNTKSNVNKPASFKSSANNINLGSNNKIGSEHATVLNQDLPKALQTSRPTDTSAGILDLSDSEKEEHIAQIFDAAKFVPGFILAERYRVIKHIGKGAFGVVVLVNDMMVNEDIILKFLNASMSSDENIIKRFVHELRYARRITHENIIRIYDFITFGGSYAISMEYFASHSLAYEMKIHKKMKSERVLKIFIDILKGVGFAHALNIVHRDLKPANILIGDNDQVKIVDFGLAAAASSSDSRITRTGILVGTPTYMAPEQVRARAIDARTDIYSLGVLLYEIFVGKPPYKGEDHLATLFQHVEGRAIAPHEADPEIPVELSQIILKAMTVNPQERFQTADEFRLELQAYLPKVGG